MRTLGCALLLLVTPALAQTTTAFGIRETPQSTTDQLVIGASSCDSSLLLYWIWTQQFPQACGNLRIWSTDATSCGNEPGKDDKEYDPVPLPQLTTLRQGTFTIVVDGLPGFKTGSPTPCGQANITKEHKICAVVQTSPNCFGGIGGAATTPTQASPLRIIYDSQAPNAPVITAVRSQDSGLKVTYSAASDVTEVVPFVRAQGETDFARRANAGVNRNKDVTLGNLANGTTYEVFLRAVDGAGNESVDGERSTGLPVKTIGLWGLYRERGGTDTGGCQLASGLLPLAALVFLSRRRPS